MQLTLSRISDSEIAQVDALDLPVVPRHRIVPTGTEPASPVDIVDEWGMQSFPASDPPANW